MIGRLARVRRPLGVVALAALSALVPAGLMVTPAEADQPGIDTSDRAAVAAAYLHDWESSASTPIGWTGSTDGCQAGTVSDAFQSATLARIDFARALVGLAPVRFDPDWSAKAQSAALMMTANGQLSHTPPPTWRCYSAEGAEGAGSSNLDPSGAGGISDYLRDPGESNSAVGHRRWVLYPPTTTMGHGATNYDDALKVFGDGGTSTANPNPSWVPWPSAGYFPVELEPNGRWSLSGAARQQWDFSAAVVTVRGPGGTSLRATTYPSVRGYGADTLVFEVEGIDTAVGTGEHDYDVSVSGIVGPAGPTSTAYTVRLFDPQATDAAPVPEPGDRVLRSRTAISGTAKVGKRLVAVEPVWEPAPTVRTYQWYRSGKPIAKATGHSYKLTTKDRRKRITLTVSTPATEQWVAASSTSKATKPVR